MLLLIFLFLLGQHSSKKPKVPSFQIISGWILAWLFYDDRPSRISDMTPYWRPWCHVMQKVLSSGECICSIHRLPTSNSVCSSWSIVHSYLLQTSAHWSCCFFYLCWIMLTLLQEQSQLIICRLSPIASLFFYHGFCRPMSYYWSGILSGLDVSSTLIGPPVDQS